MALTMSACTALRLTLPIVRRRIVMAAIPALVASPAIAELVQTPPPTNFRLLPEGRPYVNYLENASQLASHLKWYSSQVVDYDVGGGSSLNDEITQFTAIYAPRPSSLIEEGTTPGLAELMTACDALTSHFSRYDGSIATPLPDALAATVRRNAFVAQKLIKRARDSRGKWPTCGPEGHALGSRSTACSTMSVL